MLRIRGSHHRPYELNDTGRVRPFLSTLCNALLDLFFPRRCAGCGREWVLASQGSWCATCKSRLPWIVQPICPLCGRPFPDSPSSADHLCGDCLRATFRFDWARSAAYYGGVVRERLHQLKFAGQLHWVPALTELLVNTHQGNRGIPHFDGIVPVPLHPKRLSQRGFNQSALIARRFAWWLSMPVRFDLLVRQRWTEPQTRLGRRARLANVKGAFAVPKAELVEGRSLLIVDDVFTTGTTLDECAGALKRAGAKRVGAMTVARAIPGISMTSESPGS